MIDVLESVVAIFSWRYKLQEYSIVKF